MTGYYNSLIEKWNTISPTPNTAETILASIDNLNNLTINGVPRDITMQTIRSVMFSMGLWNSIFLFSYQTPTGNSVHDNAWVVAKQMVTMADNNEILYTSNPATLDVLNNNFITLASYSTFPVSTNTIMDAILSTVYPQVKWLTSDVSLGGCGFNDAHSILNVHDLISAELYTEDFIKELGIW